MIVDGEGSKTVFNGHEPQVDQKFTSSNCMIAGTASYVAWRSNRFRYFVLTFVHSFSFVRSFVLEFCPVFVRSFVHVFVVIVLLLSASSFFHLSTNIYLHFIVVIKIQLS